MASESSGGRRPVLVRRGLWLNYLTIGYNTLEAAVSLAAGLIAGSVALIGFGVDSAIEVTASDGADHCPRGPGRISARRQVSMQVS